MKMAGIDITEQVTSQQLEALAGGELLKAEVSYCIASICTVSQRVWNPFLYFSPHSLTSLGCLLCTSSKHQEVLSASA